MFQVSHGRLEAIGLTHDFPEFDEVQNYHVMFYV